jgi:hypothetical protein
LAADAMTIHFMMRSGTSEPEAGMYCTFACQCDFALSLAIWIWIWLIVTKGLAFSKWVSELQKKKTAGPSFWKWLRWTELSL